MVERMHAGHLHVGIVLEMFASAVPLTVTAPVLVMPSLEDAAGGVVSTVTAIVLELGLTLPARSVALAVKLWLPPVGLETVWLQLPCVSVKVVPIELAPSKM